MRTLCLLAVVCTAGCDQLSNVGSIGSSAEQPETTGIHWATPHDGVELSAPGKVSLVPDRGAAIDVLHVRVALTSRAGTVSGDASTAALVIPGYATAHPIAVNAPIATLPVALIDPSTPTTLDLFFPLPADRAGPGVFAWSVSTPHGVVAVRAALPLDLAAPASSLAGQRWWFAPTYGWTTFRHQDGVITVQPPRSATISGAVESDDDRAIPNPCDEW
ncbi:MAG TPA: hypothetical protein VLX92_17915 [Kofleriaceae bacterium]|nr:hypothetical protein [Kofleriaceae bacterium]